MNITSFKSFVRRKINSRIDNIMRLIHICSVVPIMYFTYFLIRVYGDYSFHDIGLIIKYGHLGIASVEEGIL